MKLHIENFLKIAEADIRLDGLTVLAGDNNTGKSTVGKVLYSLFDVYSAMEDRVRNARRRYVLDPERFPRLPGLDIDALLEDSSLSEESLFNLLQAREETHLWRVMANVFEKKPDDPVDDDEWTRQLAQELYARILKVRSIPQIQWVQSEVAKEFEDIFHGSVFTLLPLVASQSQIVLSLKNKTIEANLTDHSFSSHSGIVLFHKAWFVGSPDLMDAISRGSTRECLDRIYIPLLGKINERKSVKKFGTLWDNESLKSIWEQLQSVLPGYFKSGDRGRVLLLQSKEYPKGLPVEALSMGLKTFALLRLMLERDILQDEDVLILDEPENHLHPEWQVEYAHLLVLLQKASRLTLLVTSHSDIFVNALQRFAISEDIADSTHFYLSSKDESHPGFYTFEDRGIMTGPIFRSFNKAYDRLSKMSGEKNENDEG